MGNVVIVGSINMDVVNRVHEHPLPGETISATQTEYSPGGKGANQAVAVSRSGSAVWMVGAVGTDGFANELIETLKSCGVRTDSILRKPGTSGLAFITVDDHGENNIILSSGANGQVTPRDVDEAIKSLGSTDAVLLQNEIPWETTRFAIQAFHERGTRVFFNPAPAFEVPKEVLEWVDVLVVNETEAARISGVTVEGMGEAEQAAKTLVNHGASAVVVTLGAAGSIYVDNTGVVITHPAFEVNVVDTTAAGDTFIGAFATALCETPDDPQAAMRFASAASALTVTRRGAQVSIPNKEEIIQFLSQHA